VISPLEMSKIFFDEKGVSSPQKHSDFPKKYYQKTMINNLKTSLGAFNQEL